MPVLAVLFLLFAPLLAGGAELVNINTADTVLLETLHGIGPVKGAAIIEHREKNGLFVSIEDIQNVSGIGPVTFAGIKDFITVGEKVVAPPPSEEVPRVEKPSEPAPSSNVVQKVESVEVINRSSDHEDIVAPAAPGPALAAGASLPETTTDSVFTSPWFYSFLALIAFSGVALLLL